VYDHSIDPLLGSVSIEVEGPPVLIIEVLSDATYEADLDLSLGKGYSYANAGVREYLTLDPTGSVTPGPGRGWRLGSLGYELPWQQEADGRWHSNSVAVSVGFEGIMATVFTRDGLRMLREGEVQETIARQSKELENLRRRLGES